MHADKITTPYFLIDETLLENNLKRLKTVIDQTGCSILLAQKCFSMYEMYPLIGSYLSGTTASGLFEARLGKEYMAKENHIYSAAYREDEIDEILEICDHIIFNSPTQWMKYKEKALKSGKEFGLRINPEHSTQEGHEIYDPCAPFSRMGIVASQMNESLLEGISGLHFHTLCEQNAAPLVETLEIIEEKFGHYLKQMKWLNFGGGHHITKDDYDLELLIHTINRIQNTYHLKVYLEPGEAVALNSGFLVSSVLDIIHNKMNIAILDTSAVCHMPDVLEMPYRPNIIDAMEADIKKYTYRLGGPTCLAGDVIGDYSFDRPLAEGDRLVFCDMAIYTMVKTNTFNGINLPSIVVKKDEKYRLIKQFGYADFKSRLS
ncbi:MAG: carboxynorspermidine decarboxylase [Clostridiales bacterium]|nr:carboxynorspermidine decarboxylase [Clostridiales bacterium]